ncbi:hypothetical protein Scep_001768 [Stephania cephalantha]|uniref:Uncharacterized protein n=1 Tax=Stephania cephalantha TaxID=152367 RepID=A0AAP0LA24_9MAGN
MTAAARRLRPQPRHLPRPPRRPSLAPRCWSAAAAAAGVALIDCLRLPPPRLLA